MVSEHAQEANTGTDPDLIRQIVSRIVGSNGFVKGERLSAFLVFVTEEWLAGRAAHINEQLIGQRVFARRQDYDASADGIVRTQASRLRTRLRQYFDSEGQLEPYILDIPKGGYVPVVLPRAKASLPSSVPTPYSVGTEEVMHAKSQRRAYSWYAGILCLVALLASVATIYVLRSRDGGNVTASAARGHDFWGQFLRSTGSVLIVPGDTGLVLWEGIQGKNVDLAEYVEGAYRRDQIQKTLNSKINLRNLANRRYTTIIDAEVISDISVIAKTNSRQVDVKFARDLRPNDLKRGAVVLIGAPEANPWVELYHDKLNFELSNNRNEHEFSVVNKAPQTGEPKVWDSSYDESRLEQSKVFGVVAYLPNFDDHGEVLLLQGASMVGTESSWQFIADSAQFKAFLQKICPSNGRLPYFEVVLGSSNLDSSSTQVQVLAYRLH